MLTIGGLRADSSSAYATSIESIPHFERLNAVLLTDDDENAGRFLPRIFLRIAKKVKNEQKLCGLTEEQFKILRSTYTMNIETVRVGDVTVRLVTLHGRWLRTQELQDILKSAGIEDSHCVEYDSSQQMVLPLSNQLS